MASIMKGTYNKPNPAVKIDVGNQRQKNSAERQTQAVLICHVCDVASQVSHPLLKCSKSSSERGNNPSLKPV